MNYEKITKTQARKMHAEGKTATNAMLGYEVSDSWEGEKKVLAYHYTKGGNLIFDRLTTSKEA